MGSISGPLSGKPDTKPIYIEMESNRYNGCVVSKQGIDFDLKALKPIIEVSVCVGIFHFCYRSVLEEAQKTTMAAAIHETSSSAKRWLPLEANPDVMNQV